MSKEIKIQEFRVGLTPANVKRDYVAAGHKVYIEKDAGAAIGLLIKCINKRVQLLLIKLNYSLSEMIIKVKEPIACEYDYFHEGTNFIYISPFSCGQRINRYATC